jgi:O-methyltransferase involved in polyketide biosynthesis
MKPGGVAGYDQPESNREYDAMTGIPEKHPVSDTAALVMLWAYEYYRENPLVARYLRRLDLSAGKDLFDRYNQICPWYAEVIINRKHFIKYTVRELVEQYPGRTTIVNLGAGFSPMALELGGLLSSRCRFIEIDERNMECKNTLYTDLVPDRCGFISCIEADVTDLDSLRDALDRVRSSHLVVVMEGLSYYVGRRAMEDVFYTLSGISAEQSIVFEHIKPCRLVDSDRRFIPGQIFSHLREYTGLDRMTTYTDEEIRAILSPGFAFRYYDMSEMERRRTGSGTFFPTPGSGWLSCAVAVRRIRGTARSSGIPVPVTHFPADREPA